jgi:hypothetical protein
MPRQIVLLETPESGGVMTVTGFFWFAITDVTARVPRPGFTSAGTGLTGTKALTAPEVADLESGAVREERFSITFATSTTNAIIRGELQRRWTDRAADLAAEAPTRQFFGSSWDGTTWTA